MEQVEAYSVLKNRLQGNGSDSPARSLVITACAHGDGTSTVATGLARALAQEKSTKVLLVDANLRFPVLGIASDLAKKKGLTDWVLGELELKEVLRSTLMPNLSLMTAGTPTRQSPSDILACKAFKEKASLLHKRFDYVVWDSPPVNTFADASILSCLTDGVIMVVRSESTRWQVAQNAKKRLEQTKSNILGVVLNRRRYVIPKLIYERL